MQGFNMGRYVPPDQEGVISGNKLNRKHPLGARASKLASQGILTVRFEMPFAVWCSSCPKPTLIGQGVRFNAEKKKVGNYYSSAIFSFKMRHAACGGEIEIRTDPKNTAYVVVSGGRRRDTGDGDDDSLVRAGEAFQIVTEAERREQRESAFANLEKTIEDRQRLEVAKERIGELQDAASRQWEDPYSRNQRLRRAFRSGRKARERDAAAAEDLKDRMSLGIDLMPATEEDGRRAALVEFGSAGQDAPVDEALTRPLFNGIPKETRPPEERTSRDGKAATKATGKLKSEIAASKMRESLLSEIVGNTRMAKDPFLDFGGREVSKSCVGLPGIKRKRVLEEAPDPPEKETPTEAVSNSSLVEYDSD
jgi:coiled-coil domain-containing protein 130